MAASQLFALFDCGCAFPVDVAVADFNGDGKNDVAETSSSGVSILLGDGAGNLGTPRVLTAGVAPDRIVAADLNGDGKIDLAVTNLGSNTVSIFLGRGDGHVWRREKYHGRHGARWNRRRGFQR